MKIYITALLLPFFTSTSLQNDDKIDPLSIDDKTRSEFDALLKKLNDDVPDTRDKAEKEIVEYLDDDIKFDFLKTSYDKGAFDKEFEIKMRLERIFEEYGKRRSQLIVKKSLVNRTVCRVLYIEGVSRFEWSFLINAMVKDDVLKAWGLLLDADPDWPQPKPLLELNPVNQVPEKLDDLLKYDVLIIGDLDTKKYTLNSKAKNSDILENIKKFAAENNKGIIFISGTRGNPESFKDTPLEDILPFKLNPKIEQPKTAQDLIKLEVASDQLSHPLILEPDPINPDRLLSENESKKIWEEKREGIYWYKKIINVDKDLKSGAIVLLYGELGDKKLPIVITGTFGSGKILYMATDETWRWRKLKGDKPYFFPFWQRAIEWTSNAAKIYLTTDKNKYPASKQVQITALILVDPKKSVEAFIIDSTGKKENIKLEYLKDMKYMGSFKPSCAGYHKVEIKDDKTGKTAITQFYVYK